MSDEITIIIADLEPDIINVEITNVEGADINVEVLYPEGPPGPQGIPGPPGPPGSGFYFVHQQMVPDTVWTINHNLNGFPNVSAVESDGSKIDGDVFYVDANTVTFTIAWPISGKAYLS